MLRAKMSELMAVFCGSLVLNILLIFISLFNHHYGFAIFGLIYDVALFFFAFGQLLYALREDKKQEIFIETIRKKRKLKPGQLQ